MQLFRKILWPISLLYGIGVTLRNLSFDLGIRKSRKFKTASVSVGNLSLGGTGKTPMIEWLVRNLKTEKRLAVLSRGYKRSTSGFVLADVESDASTIGDEPYQIYRKFPNLIMAVDANRTRAILKLEEECRPDLILLDDAFQHRKISPSYSILLTAYHNLYTDDWFLPTGDLRDAKDQARRANMIVVTKCPSDLGREEMNHISSKIKPTASQDVLFCSLLYATHLSGSAEVPVMEELEGRTITVVTGIANPNPFIEHLEKRGLRVNHLKYGDHHRFTSSELASLGKEELILTTEKDYVRSLYQLDNVAYLEVQHHFLGNGAEQLLSAINGLEG